MFYHAKKRRGKTLPPFVRITPQLIRGLEADFAAAGIVATPADLFNMFSRPAATGVPYGPSK